MLTSATRVVEEDVRRKGLLGDENRDRRAKPTDIDTRSHGSHVTKEHVWYMYIGYDWLLTVLQREETRKANYGTLVGRSGALARINVRLSCWVMK